MYSFNIIESLRIEKLFLKIINKAKNKGIILTSVLVKPPPIRGKKMDENKTISSIFIFILFKFITFLSEYSY